MGSSLNGTGVTFSNGQTQSSSAIGDNGQTWQDVTSSRAIGTTYTNSTGRPIAVYAISNSNALGVTVNGTTLIPGGTYTFEIMVFIIIPTGATYSLSGGSLGKWLELR